MIDDQWSQITLPPRNIESRYPYPYGILNDRLKNTPLPKMPKAHSLEVEAVIAFIYIHAIYSSMFRQNEAVSHKNFTVERIYVLLCKQCTASTRLLSCFLLKDFNRQHESLEVKNSLEDRFHVCK